MKEKRNQKSLKRNWKHHSKIISAITTIICIAAAIFVATKANASYACNYSDISAYDDSIGGRSVNGVKISKNSEILNYALDTWEKNNNNEWEYKGSNIDGYVDDIDSSPNSPVFINGKSEPRFGINISNIKTKLPQNGSIVIKKCKKGRLLYERAEFTYQTENENKIEDSVSLLKQIAKGTSNLDLPSTDYSFDGVSYIYDIYDAAVIGQSGDIYTDLDDCRIVSEGYAYYGVEGEYIIKKLPAVEHNEMDGYTCSFDGWYTQEGYKIHVGDAIDFKTTIYPRWNISRISYNVNYIDILGDQPNGEVLKTTTSTVYCNDEASGADMGNDESAGVYYAGLYYTGCTSVTVQGDCDVYRYFRPALYNVVFNGNMATSGETATLSNCIYGETYKLTENDFKRNGTITLDLNAEDAICVTKNLNVVYEFKGWSETADGNAVYTDCESVSNLCAENGEKQLYAVWNGGAIDISAIPERKGYCFDGWSKDKSAVSGNTWFDVSDCNECTLYAIWIKKQEETDKNENNTDNTNNSDNINNSDNANNSDNTNNSDKNTDNNTSEDIANSTDTSDNSNENKDSSNIDNSENTGNTENTENQNNATTDNTGNQNSTNTSNTGNQNNTNTGNTGNQNSTNTGNNQNNESQDNTNTVEVNNGSENSSNANNKTEDNKNAGNITTDNENTVKNNGENNSTSVNQDNKENTTNTDNSIKTDSTANTENSANTGSSASDKNNNDKNNSSTNNVNNTGSSNSTDVGNSSTTNKVQENSTTNTNNKNIVSNTKPDSTISSENNNNKNDNNKNNNSTTTTNTKNNNNTDTKNSNGTNNKIQGSNTTTATTTTTNTSNDTNTTSGSGINNKDTTVNTSSESKELSTENDNTSSENNTTISSNNSTDINDGNKIINDDTIMQNSDINADNKKNNAIKDNIVYPKAGKKYTRYGIIYKVIKSNSKKRTVKVIKATKNITRAKVPNNIKIKGYKYKVVSIDKKAFIKCSHLKKVIVGKNIRNIGKKAFYKNKALGSVIIKSKKLTNIGRNAFKYIKSKCTVKIAGSKKYSQKVFAMMNP